MSESQIPFFLKISHSIRRDEWGFSFAPPAQFNCTADQQAEHHEHRADDIRHMHRLTQHDCALHVAEYRREEHPHIGANGVFLEQVEPQDDADDRDGDDRPA